MPIIRGKNALTNPKLLQMMETGDTDTLIHILTCEYKVTKMDLSHFGLIFFPDGSIQDGDNLSPTDIEANLSTEVSLTVLDVLELFVHHHKVCGPLQLHVYCANSLLCFLGIWYML